MIKFSTFSTKLRTVTKTDCVDPTYLNRRTFLKGRTQFSAEISEIEIFKHHVLPPGGPGVLPQEADDCVTIISFKPLRSFLFAGYYHVKMTAFTFKKN